MNAFAYNPARTAPAPDINAVIVDAMRELCAATHAADERRAMAINDDALSDRLDAAMHDAAKLLSALLRSEGIDPRVIGGA